MKMRRRARKYRRGATLIEAMVAVAVLGIGTAAAAGLIQMVAKAKQQMAFQRRATEMYQLFTAQLEDASCDVDITGAAMGAIDGALTAPPGFLNAGCGPAPCGGCPAASTVTTCGDMMTFAPIVNVSWQVDAGPIGGPAVNAAPPEYHLTLRVRAVTNDPVKDAAASTGTHVRNFPVNKICNIRTDADPLLRRGEF